MGRNNTIAEIGKFKEEIHSALFKNQDILELLLGDINNMSPEEIISGFKKHVESHLYIDEIVDEAITYIFYDVRVSNIEKELKNIRVIMYVIAPRNNEIGDYYKEGYHGNKTDILSEMIEDTLINDEKTANTFGIGKLRLTDVDIYNATRFYGRVLTFKVSTFR